MKLALDTLRKNKLRSGLTILGITIGISTVILISSAINGLNTNINQFVSALGTNDLWIFRFEVFGRRPTTEELNRKKLTYEDGLAMRNLPHVVAVDPELTYQNFQTGLGSVSLKAGTHKISNTIINGATTEVTQTKNVELQEGRMWTDSEEAKSSQRGGAGPRCRRGSVSQPIAAGQGRGLRGRYFYRHRRSRQAAATLRQRTEHTGQLGAFPAGNLPYDSSGD